MLTCARYCWTGVHSRRPDDSLRPPLYLAAKKGRVGIVEVLLQHNADPNHPKLDNGATPVYVAAELGRLLAIQALLAHGADLNQPKVDNGVTPGMQYFGMQCSGDPFNRCLQQHRPCPCLALASSPPAISLTPSPSALAFLFDLYTPHFLSRTPRLPFQCTRLRKKVKRAS